MSLATWLGFLLASIIIAVTPGPGALFSISTAMHAGYRVALRGILGLQVALLIQIAIVAVGLGALLATSETAFALFKFSGAMYLVWLGVQRWRSPPSPLKLEGHVRTGAVFREAVLVNMTNPKSIVFIGALVPQFVDPHGSLLLQYVIIGLTLCLTDVVVMSGYALAGIRVAHLFGNERLQSLQQRVFGALFVLAGVLLALTGHQVELI